MATQRIGAGTSLPHICPRIFLNLEEDFRTSLLMFSPWLSSQNHTEDTTKIGYPLGVESGPPFELHLYTLSFVDAVLCGEISLGIFLSLIARWLG